MCRPPTPFQPVGRSAITNGTRLHSNSAKVDGRTQSARRLRDLITAFSKDLGDGLSEADLSLVRTAAALTLQLEMLQADLANGVPVDVEMLVKLAGTSKRSLAAISARAVDKKPAGTMTLQEYMAAKQAATESDDESDD
jgi:hypothetical protein